MTKTIMITNCSVSRTKEPIATMAKLPKNSIMSEALAAWWAMVDPKINDVAQMHPPSEIYRGGGFLEATALCTSESIDQLYIVTGGQGLIKADELIVPYDFSGSKKEDTNIYQYVTRGPFIAHQWWAEINKLRSGHNHPIQDLVSDANTGMVYITCTKVFLKYIERDLLTVPSQLRSKLAVFIPASSMGSVAKQLRDCLFPYTRAMIEHLPGNRNNSTQRAALLYSSLKNKGMTHQEIFTWFIANAGKDSSNETDDDSTIQAVHTYLKSDPAILQMTAEQAYQRARTVLGNVGGILAFKGIFRDLAGIQFNQPSDATSLEALQALGLEAINDIMTDEDEILTLELLAILAKTLKEHSPTAQVTSAQVTQWAKNYCTQKNITLPKYMETSAKLARLLSSNAQVVGLKEITSSSVSGKRYVAL